MLNKINQTRKEKIPLGLSYMSNIKKKVKNKKNRENETIATKGKSRGN